MLRSRYVILQPRTDGLGCCRGCLTYAEGKAVRRVAGTTCHKPAFGMTTESSTVLMQHSTAGASTHEKHSFISLTYGCLLKLCVRYAASANLHELSPRVCRDANIHVLRHLASVHHVRLHGRQRCRHLHWFSLSIARRFQGVI